MALERHGQLPVCRLTEQDLRKLAKIFETLQSDTKGTGVYKVETPWGTYSGETLDFQSTSYAPGDVKRLEMNVQWEDGTARLTVDLEVSAQRTSLSVFRMRVGWQLRVPRR